MQTRTPTANWPQRMAESPGGESLRAFAAERGYAQATVERWLGLNDADRDALLALARDLRLGENQLRDLWHWAEEIAARDGGSLAEVLDASRSHAERVGLGRADRLKRVKAALRRRRFPQLAAREDRIAGLVEQLGLPGVQIRWPAFLEGDVLRFEFEARSSEGLAAHAAALLAAARHPVCREIFAVLDGDAE